jgi:restriction system protein
MIEDPFPSDWRQLQEGVCRILVEIGLTAESGKKVETPRGRVELDVYAVDVDSVDKISYAIECKNWSSGVPQSVVHSFTTVMHEVGANIGYIVSREGLQSGAIGYIRNTNIRGLTYEEFQEHYFNAWFERFFVRRLGDVVDPLAQYVEPFNSSRDRKLAQLDESKVQRFRELSERYQIFGMFMALFEFPRYGQLFAVKAPMDIDLLKNKVEQWLGSGFRLQPIFYRDLLSELVGLVRDAVTQFDEVFGSRIFDPQIPPGDNV